jgi:hypothetical protein
MPKQRREGEANGPRGQRPPGASRAGPSWTEFVRPAHQAVVAFAGAGIINRAEPRACGHSREPIYLDSEPDTERNAGSASNAAGDGCGRARSDKAGFQPYRGKLAVRDEQRGWGKRRQDLMAVCHDARKGRNIGIHWSKPVAPPLHSTIHLLSGSTLKKTDRPVPITFPAPIPHTVCLGKYPVHLARKPFRCSR